MKICRKKVQLVQRPKVRMRLSQLRIIKVSMPLAGNEQKRGGIMLERQGGN